MATRLVRPTTARLPKTTIDAWRAVPSAVAADRLQGRGHADAGIRPIRPLPPGATLVGSAVTAGSHQAVTALPTRVAPGGSGRIGLIPASA